jgi:WD40 repeat protein
MHLEYIVKLSRNNIINFSSEKTIKVWHIESGDCLNTLEGHEDYVYSIDTY